MKYEMLTKHIPALTGDHGGEFRCTESGSPLGPEYSDAQNAFLQDFHGYLASANEDFRDYLSVLDDAGDKPVLEYAPREALAKIFSFIRGERFCDGCLLDAFRSGQIIECLLALRRSDEAAEAKRSASRFARLKDRLTGK